jgi:hypothetical protein
MRSGVKGARSLPLNSPLIRSHRSPRLSRKPEALSGGNAEILITLLSTYYRRRFYGRAYFRFVCKSHCVQTHCTTSIAASRRGSLIVLDVKRLVPPRVCMTGVTETARHKKRCFPLQSIGNLNSLSSACCIAILGKAAGEVESS